MPDLSGIGLPALTIVGAAALLGLYFGLGARRARLPSLIGYMLLGVLLGPSVLNLLSDVVVDRLGFVTEIALGLVAFSIGSELNVGSLRRLGWGIVSIILTESFGAFLVVAAAIFAVTGDLPLALVFGAMAPASAPAGTVAVIQENRASGNLTKALYAVVGFDDGLAIIIFGFAAAAARSLLVVGTAAGQAALLPAMLEPLREIGLSLLVGGVLGMLFSVLVRRLRNPREILILAFGCVAVATGISIHWHLSLILTNMVVGFILTNTRRETFVHHVVAPVHDIMPLVFVLFFCLAGAHLKLAALPALGLVGLVYILGRSAGLIGGARLGAMIGRVDRNVKKYVGLGILSQAGVAIGLSLIVSQDFSELGSPHAARIGTAVLTTITATSIFFEIIGPILTKIALRKAGEIPAEAAPGPPD